eukprot:SAG31_NODE_83_length_27039_cov_14.035746_17_plen_131_part_00
METMRLDRLDGDLVNYLEYMALMHACVDIIWLRQLLTELGITDMVNNPTITLGDNDQATKLSREDINTRGNRYIRTHFPFAKECVEKQLICPRRRVSTLDNLSDIMTKPLSRQYIGYLRPDLISVLTGWT